MPRKSIGHSAHHTALFAAVCEVLAPKTRKVRRIVTVSGRGVRGHFPSLKAEGRAQFESLVEEAALRVLEVAPSVATVQTQPEVLLLTDGGVNLTYTPDIKATVRGAIHFFEVKPDRFSQNEAQVRRIRKVCAGMRSAKLAWSIVLEGDLRSQGLQEELRDLLRLRPVAGKQRRDLDLNTWDPLGGTRPDDITATRWAKAQVACDDLLQRAMRRDPDELLPQLAN